MAPEYQILDQFHSQQRHIKIVHVGAGPAGLLTAYKARKFLKNYELTCYEKYANTAHQKIPFFLEFFMLKSSQESYGRRDMVGKQVPTYDLFLIISPVSLLTASVWIKIGSWDSTDTQGSPVTYQVIVIPFRLSQIRIGAVSMLLVKKFKSTLRTSTESMIYLHTWGLIHW